MELNSGYSVLNCLCTMNGTHNRKESFCWGPGMRDSYSLGFILKGKGTISLDGKKFLVTKGQSFLAFPFCNITVTADKDDPWKFKWVEFKGLEAAWLISQTAFGKNNPVVGKIHLPNFENYFDIINDDNNLVFEQCRSNAKLFLLLSYYIEFFPRKAERANNYAVMARDYIEKNYRNVDCTAKNVAEYVKLDRTYLFRLFKEETGCSVLDYINNCRISKACVMLIDKNITVKDVAYSVGFIDQMYFSKVFKKLKGSTPTEYRKKHFTLSK